MHGALFENITILLKLTIAHVGVFTNFIFIMTTREMGVIPNTDFIKTHVIALFVMLIYIFLQLSMHMHFSWRSSFVIIGSKNFCQSHNVFMISCGTKFATPNVFDCSIGHFNWGFVIDSAISIRIHSCNQCSSRRCTNWSWRVAMIKYNTLFCQTINIGSDGNFTTISTSRFNFVLIGNDKNNIRSF